MDIRFAVPQLQMETTNMIISGKLLTPTGEPLSGSTIRLTATTNSQSMLKSSSTEFTTDTLGEYSIDVPIGRYHVEQHDRLNRAYRSIGVLTIAADTTVADLATLLMVEQTTTPRDPLLQEIETKVVAAQQAASQASSSVQGIDATVATAIDTALANYEFPAGVNGVDGVSPVFSIGTVQAGDITSATITGTQANPILNLVIQRGQQGVAGATGLQGLQGVAGAQGPIGLTGAQGIQGATGAAGVNGIDGVNGVDGKSAYQLAVDAGFVGTEPEWRASLKGVKGDTGATGAQGLAGPQGIQGVAGPQGEIGPIGPEGPSPDTSTFATKTELNALTKIEQLTQAQYDALATKDANTLYVVVG